MMNFKYTATNSTGTYYEGIISAESQEAALQTLRTQNLVVTSLIKLKQIEIAQKLSFFDFVSLKELVNFSRQVSALLEAGVPILKAFQLIESDTQKPFFKSILTAVIDDIKSGKSISEALSKHKRAFDDFYVSMVRSGEESAKISKIFSYLADYLDRNYSLTVKVRNSLIYPTFVVATFVIVMILVFTVVIPKLATILTDSNVALPIMTQIVLGISNFLVSYGLYIFIVLIISSVFIYMRFRETSYFKDYFDEVKLKVPFLSNLFKMLYVTRIADNIETLLGSGVSLTKAISITSDVVGNNQYKKILTDALEDVRTGIPFSDAMAKNPRLIPPTMVQMIRIGEETAEVGKLLGNVAKFYQREINATIDTLVGMIEPAMIVLLGLGVGLLLVSVLLPIYNLASAF